MNFNRIPVLLLITTELTNDLKIKHENMKKLLLVLLVSFSLFTNAQQWIPLGNGTGREVTAFTVYNGELVIGGWFQSPGNAIGIWNGSSYGPLGTGMTGFANNFLTSVCVFNGELYAAGLFGNANGVATTQCLARWNGLKWSAVGSGITMGAGIPLINCMKVYNNELYVGGLFDNAGGVAVNNIAKWDGNTWSDVAGGTSIGGLVTTMTTHGLDLYVAGAFTTMGGTTADRIAKWNGTVWSALGTGNTFVGGNPLTIASNDTDIFLGGGFTQIGSTSLSYIARWDGTNWNAMGTGADQRVNTIYGYDGKIYVGGNFTNMDNVTGTAKLAKWNSATWSAMSTGMNDGVYAFMVYNWGLYTGGLFTQASSVTANYIALWDAAVGVDEKNKQLDKATLYPNPVSSKAFINIPSSYGELKGLSVILYDLTGRAVKTISSPSNYNVTFDRAGLSSGLYFYQISDGSKVLASDKFIVE